MPTMTSTIYLCTGVPLSNRYDHTLYFDTPAAQTSYFAGMVNDTVNEVSYLRKSWPLKIRADMEQARRWNYLFFRNHDEGKRWFYFVTDVQYINDNTVELTLELDVLQTYMFDWTLRDCFVEREHTRTDNYGEHTIDEGLEAGELVVNGEMPFYWAQCVIMILATVQLNVSGFPDVLASKYNGIYSGAAVYATEINHATNLGLELERLAEAGKIDSIVSMWMYPKELVTLDASKNVWGDDTICKSVAECKRISTALEFNRTLDGWNRWKNQKTAQYPYNFIYVTNNVGGAAAYRYELFGDHLVPTVSYLGTISAEGVAYMYPLNYKGVQHNYDEGLQMSGFPQCSWNADTYKLWLAQNQNQHNLTIGTNALTLAAGAATAIGGAVTGALPAVAAGAGMMTHGATGIQSLLAQKKDMSIQPPQARGAHSGSLNMVANQMGYVVQYKSVDVEHAKAIDDFFTMYGYAVHRVKTPSIKNRPGWTYVKTRDSNVTGPIPHGDLTRINQIFDNGVTFWVNPANVGNYSGNNAATS